MRRMDRPAVDVPGGRASRPLFLLAPVALLVLFQWASGDGTTLFSALSAASPRSAAIGALLSSRPLPEEAGEMCAWAPPDPGVARGAPGGRVAEDRRSTDLTLTPLRTVRDPFPSFSSVAVDMQRGEVAATDENLLQILVYDRLANTPAEAESTAPRRAIGGDRTKIEFVCGTYIDQRTGEIFGVNNDTQNTFVGFSREARGDARPDKELDMPHGAFGIAVNERHGEMFFTIQHTSAVVTYPKGAVGEELPVRLLQGDRTRLADPHGIAVDEDGDLLFVTNHGSVQTVRPEAGAWLGGDFLSGLRRNWPLERAFSLTGSGRIVPPSITTYRRTAQGDTAPLRVIAGPKTQLNWPAGIAYDPKRGELYVANDTGHAVLVFRARDEGDVAPIRVIEGPRTGIRNPTGLFLDTLHDELWVANFGAHSLTVYRPTASGDVAPLRTIRSGPAAKRSLMIGNPGALAYDTKREEILVPN